MTELGRVVLRNEYVVLEATGGYTVHYEDNKGQVFEQFVAEDIVRSAQDLLSGGDWSVAEAKAALRETAEDEGWPFAGGYKYQYFVQHVLVTLVALGEAGHHKEPQHWETSRTRSSLSLLIYMEALRHITSVYIWTLHPSLFIYS